MIEHAQYAELHCHSWFSLLDGASSPEALAARAAHVELQALALTDHNSLAGAVRFARAAQQERLHGVFGAEVTLEPLHAGDAANHLTLLAETQQGYSNLCKLITASRLDHLPAPPESYDPAATASDWPGKVPPLLSWQRLGEHAAGIIALTGCARGPVATPLLQNQPEAAQAAVRRLLEIFGQEHLCVEVQHHSRARDNWLVRRLCAVARDFALPVVATNNVHYAERKDSHLHDAMLAIDENISLSAARQRGLLPGHNLAYLAGPQEMAQRFRELPEALTNTLAIAERCRVSLDFSAQRLPAFLPPAGATGSRVSEFQYLYQLCHDNLARRYPVLRPAVLTQLAHELEVIEKAHLAGFFLLVWDIVQFAREQGIRCQGRGSAAGSIVAYLLGITAIDPLAHDLLFERFLSEDRFTMPDIDIDFAADRREEVIQYVYRRYGRAHAAMVCNHVTYHARSALRDLGKVLEISPTLVDRWESQLESNNPAEAANQLEQAARDNGAKVGGTEEAGAEEENSTHLLRLLADLMRQLDGAPRHLSIHSGGMLLTGMPLDEIVPLEAATMPGRIIAQWDKASVEDAGLIKLDILGLGMLGAISEAVALAQDMGEPAPDLDALALDDPGIYAMLQQGDTIGAFQVESRAQTQLLPRLKPTCFADIVVQVAIVRPGPIQGGAVHPYLRRRAGLEPVQYLHPSLEPVLRETYGVVLFQEQVLRTAVTVAGFTAGEADMLRRAMSRNRGQQAMQALKERFMHGARQQGVDDATAEQVFAQLQGFASYGFPKSHAASFALVAYQSMWLLRYRPAAFYASLMNQQPMGFYSVEVLAGAARRHGVDILPARVEQSTAKYLPERTPRGRWALRTGLAAVAQIGNDAVQRILDTRAERPFADLTDFCMRTRLDRDLVSNLIRAGACDGFLASNMTRRDLLWQLGGIDYRPDELLLPQVHTQATLPEIDQQEQEIWEHELTGLAPAGNIMRHYRAQLRRRRIAGTWEVKQMQRGRQARVAGMMVVRQHPQTANGIVFISLEDEAGLLDLVVKPNVWQRLREVLYREPLVMVTGEVQRSGGAVSVLVDQATPLIELLGKQESDAIARATKSWF